MSHVAHTQPQPLRVRLPLWITVAAVALLAGAAIAVYFVVSADDDAGSKTAVSGAAGVRYDRGPNEGTALTQRSAPATFDPNSIKEAPGVRYDGGPEEGTAGVLPAGQPNVTPETEIKDEASIAAAIGQPSSGTELRGSKASGIRYDGGPEEGTGGIRHSGTASAGQVYVNPSTGYPATRFDGSPGPGQ
jgi:hypothetical protein